MNDQSEKIDQIIEKFKNEKGTIIGLMQDIHGEYRYLPEEVLLKVSAELDIPMAKLYTLATFYKSFRLEPVGKHHVRVCIGTACHVNGATKIVETLERELGVKSGQTTEDNQFTLETVNCLGACALGPLVLVDGEYHGKIDQGKLKKLLNKYRKD
ncbi:MAG: NADH-quinone oxidoreductase subunit NuoE [Spirochaetes bacterium]|nr:NADH-quinone oxidoreductase subunit NuoE [Spirochaetota bacterium]